MTLIGALLAVPLIAYVVWLVLLLPMVEWTPSLVLVEQLISLASICQNPYIISAMSTPMRKAWRAFYNEYFHCCAAQSNASAAAVDVVVAYSAQKQQQPDTLKNREHQNERYHTAAPQALPAVSSS